MQMKLLILMLMIVFCHGCSSQHEGKRPPRPAKKADQTSFDKKMIPANGFKTKLSPNAYLLEYSGSDTLYLLRNDKLIRTLELPNLQFKLEKLPKIGSILICKYQSGRGTEYAMWHTMFLLIDKKGFPTIINFPVAKSESWETGEGKISETSLESKYKLINQKLILYHSGWINNKPVKGKSIFKWNSTRNSYDFQDGMKLGNLYGVVGVKI